MDKKMSGISLGKNALAVTIILLFIGMSVVPSTGTVDKKKFAMPTFYDGNTLYVGGDGPGNYSRIQDAIDNASDGDTVFVYDDSSPYYENIVIGKSIILIGENKNTTVIDGGGKESIAYISANYTTITGFMIVNCGSEIYNTGIKVRANYTTIAENIITNNKWYGIYLENTSNNIIYGNSITNSNHCGIYLNNSCDHNIIYRNNIINHRSYCIYLSSLSEYNIIYENTIVNNQTGFSIRGSFNNIYKNSFEEGAIILLYMSYKNTVINNTFERGGFDISGSMLYHWGTHFIENNTINGRPIRYYKNTNRGEPPSDTSQVILANCSNFTIQKLDIAYSNIQIGFSSHNSILGNYLHNSNWNGIKIQSSFDNNVTGNTLTDNGAAAISMRDSSYNIVSRNTAISNGGGIFLLSNCTNNLVSNNIVSNNYGSGMRLYQTSHNIISGNTLTKNTHQGINMMWSYNNTVIDNNISETTMGIIQVGIYLDWSNDNMVTGNRIARNFEGIFIEGNNNIIIENTFENNYREIAIFGGNNNKIYHNNFFNKSCTCNSGENMWDDGISMGNHWSRWYYGTDDDGDGIGDTPKLIGDTQEDRYPLMFPYGEETGVKITRPERGFLYIRDHKILPFFTTLIIGKIKIEVNAANYIYGIDRVDFYVDNIKRRSDMTPPYSWVWKMILPIKHRHVIKAIAYDNNGKNVSDDILVWKFF